MFAAIDRDSKLTERWLLAIALGVWLVAGSTSIGQFVTRPARVGLLPWAVAYGAFGALFLLTTASRRPRALRLLALAAQAALAVVLSFLGMPVFEGALLAVVAAQTPTVLPLWASLVWAALQLIPLWAALSGSYGVVEITKSMTSYIGISGFAIVALRLFEAERRARVALDQAIQDLMSTRAQLADRARLAERVRIARDLHDVLGHHLTALAIHLEVAGRSQDTDLRGAVEQARGFVGRMLQDVRATVQDVGAESVDLAGAIRSMVSSLSGPAIELALPEKLRLGANHAQAAFRVVQEAITNTLRHANAKHVRVSARQDEEAVEVQVEDDGRGVDGVPEGNGLRGMRQRIEGLGGTLSIKSSGVMGTQVRVRIPTQRYP